MPDAPGPVPRAHGSTPLRWLEAHDPLGGLPREIHDRLRSDPVERGRVVQALLDRFFDDQPAADVLAAVGMARDVGRDPAWVWDELVLACDLVAHNGWHELPVEDPRVIGLSQLLRSLPIHPVALRGPRFRSPDSVRRKMADIATRHPNSRRRPTNGGKLDLEVLGAFLEHPGEMHAIAELIRTGAQTDEFDELPRDDIDARAMEGRLLERRHLRRERDPRLRERKIRAVLDRDGRLECEVCSFDFERTYGPRGAGYAECHHVIPLHASGETVTRLRDLAVLCANCHRMIHRGTRWLTVDELRELVRGQ
ncbi:HNH endonuclease [Actinocrispum wychmicini]|uniref:HNH endonuclease n=1 Tax=Actinocrispum wychmicini TaxID=1213861 RepID=UPI001404DCCA|nr:HNH endonuclease [Actinocrispum wychmicini]